MLHNHKTGISFIKKQIQTESNEKYPPNQGRIIQIPQRRIFFVALSPPAAARSGGEGEGIEIPFFIAEQ